MQDQEQARARQDQTEANTIGDNRNQQDQSWSVREARIMLNMVELKLQVDNGPPMTGGQCDDHGVRMRCRTMD